MPDRRRRKNPRRHQQGLRLNDREKYLLEVYTHVRDHPSEAAALRHMINGLESWLAKHIDRVRAAGYEVEELSSAPSLSTDVETSHTREADSGLPSATSPDPHSGLPSPESINSSDVDITDESVGDFGGRPAVGLPNPSWHEDD